MASARAFAASFMPSSFLGWRCRAMGALWVAAQCGDAHARMRDGCGDSGFPMRWKTSSPRTLRPAAKALPLATIVVGLTKRPDQLVVTLQSDVQFLEF